MQPDRRMQFITHTLFYLLILCVVSCTDSTKQSGYIFPQESWEQIASPGAAGWSEAGLKAVRKTADSLDTAALMIVHRGVVIDSWGDLGYKYRCHSLRKSFLSALYGIHIANGTIDPNATMLDLGIDDNLGLSETEKQATVRQLLQARSGVYHPALFETAAMAAARPARHSRQPGTHYYYNNWDFNALGTIYEQETGENIHKSFGHRIAARINMQDYIPGDGRVVTGEESRHAAYPFVMSTRDLARFGLLYLNGGIWAGERILPESWVEESTAVHSDIRHSGEYGSSAGGYGYMWWVSVEGQHFDGIENVPAGTYTGRGFGGHVLAVVPEYDLVIVHRVDTGEPGNRVSYGEFGKLFMMILDAYAGG